MDFTHCQHTLCLHDINAYVLNLHLSRTDIFFGELKKIYNVYVLCVKNKMNWSLVILLNGGLRTRTYVFSVVKITVDEKEMYN